MPALAPDRARQLAGLTAAARTALGVVAVVAPQAPLAPWVGSSRQQPGTRLLGRALGGRDLALGLGGLDAVLRGRSPRPWVLAGGLADAGDVAATLLHWRDLPRGGRAAVLVAAGGGVVAALLSVQATAG